MSLCISQTTYERLRSWLQEGELCVAVRGLPVREDPERFRALRQFPVEGGDDVMSVVRSDGDERRIGEGGEGRRPILQHAFPRTFVDYEHAGQRDQVADH